MHRQISCSMAEAVAVLVGVNPPDPKTLPKASVTGPLAEPFVIAELMRTAFGRVPPAVKAHELSVC